MQKGGCKRKIKVNSCRNSYQQTSFDGFETRRESIYRCRYCKSAEKNSGRVGTQVMNGSMIFIRGGGNQAERLGSCRMPSRQPSAC